MHLFRYKLLLMVFSLSINAFDDNQCFTENFSVEVSHKGQPFGLLPVVLKVEKLDCDINIFHEKLKFKKNAWKIDVCRTPVHIKKGIGAVEVIKKNNSCLKGSNEDFCQEFKEIERVIQDDGLIFAKGQKEVLETPHGKTYCAYLLLKKYLAESLVFTRGEDYAGVLKKSLVPLKRYSSDEKAPIKSTDDISPPRPVIVGDDSTKIQEKIDFIKEKKKTEDTKKAESGKGFF